MTFSYTQISYRTAVCPQRTAGKQAAREQEREADDVLA